MRWRRPATSEDGEAPTLDAAMGTFHVDWPVRIPGDAHGDVEYAITRAQSEAARDAR